MLIDFAITNFRSIKERQVFTMAPRAKVKELEQNVCTGNDYKLLKSAIVYGRNGSGKSNLIRAVYALSFMLRNPPDLRMPEGGSMLFYEPFEFDADWKSRPVEIEMNFYAKNNLRYNYIIAYSKSAVIKESLFFYPGKKPAKLFVREVGKTIDYGTLLGDKYKEIEKATYSNQLFLSKVAINKIDPLIPPYTFLTYHFFPYAVLDSAYEESLMKVHIQMMAESEQSNFARNVNKLLQVSDIGIKGIVVKENKETDFAFPDSISEALKRSIINSNKYSVKTIHDLYKNGKVVAQTDLDFEKSSTGTKKLLSLGGLIVDALTTGNLLVVDELDKSLHPLLSKTLINIFNNPKTNPNNAQLIFASHDVSLLDNTKFRRDQIWLVEKNEEGASEYYTIADIQDVRKDVPYDKWYLSGRFNAIPVINEEELDFDFSTE